MSPSETNSISVVHVENKLNYLILKLSKDTFKWRSNVFHRFYTFKSEKGKVTFLASESILDMHRWNEIILWCNW